MKTITFYSYKGGVGRSLALVNIATRLAEFGKKVCVLDFDLEAPGLHLKFPIPKIATLKGIQKGIVDYVFDFSKNGVIPSNINTYGININVAKNRIPITLIPAGNIDSVDYWKKLSSINWYDLIYEEENGLAFFINLKESIKKDFEPDFLLIDSRTGISEMSGITLCLLADEVVIVAANNKENLSGAKKIINSISNPENSLFEKAPKITFVLSRIPFTDKPEDKSKEILLINKIKRDYLLPVVNEVNVIHSDRELEENEKVKIAYEKDESNPQSSRDYLALFEKLTVNDLSDDEIRKFKSIRESEKLYSLAISDFPVQQKLEFISKAIELNDNNYELYLFRANINCDLKNYDSAKNDINAALRLNEHNLSANNLLIRVLYDNKEYDSALALIEKLIQSYSVHPYLLAYRGMIYTNLNEYELAQHTFDELLKIDPDSATGYSLKGNILRLKGQYKQALECVYKALEIDSEYVVAIATLAEINAHMGDVGAFYIHLENSLRINPKMMESVIIEEPIYRQFFKDDRFRKLLDKYDIFFDESNDFK